jgi:hypothetical protein
MVNHVSLDLNLRVPTSSLCTTEGFQRFARISSTQIGLPRWERHLVAWNFQPTRYYARSVRQPWNTRVWAQTPLDCLSPLHPEIRALPPCVAYEPHRCHGSAHYGDRDRSSARRSWEFRCKGSRCPSRQRNRHLQPHGRKSIRTLLTLCHSLNDSSAILSRTVCKRSID